MRKVKRNEEQDNSQLELFRSDDALHLPLDHTQRGSVVEPKTPEEVVAFTLEYLNRLTERAGAARFRSATAVKERIKEGATWRDLALVIDFCHAMWWGDRKMEPYIRPKTLFGKENFPEYLVRARKWDEDGRPPLIEQGGAGRGDQRRLDVYSAHVKGGAT